LQIKKNSQACYSRVFRQDMLPGERYDALTEDEKQADVKVNYETDL
jgi:hypothetical protein